MALKTNVSDYRFSIFINNDQAKQSVVEMEGVVKKYQSALADMEKNGQKGTGPWKDMKTALDQANANLVGFKKEAGLASLSMKDLKGLYNSLLNEFGRSIPGSPAAAQVKKELDSVAARIDEVKYKSQGIGKEMGEGGLMGKILGVAGGISLAGMAEKSFSAVKDFVKEGIKSSIELRDSEKLLLDVLDGNSTKQKELIALAKERGGNTKFTRLETEEAEKFLVIQGRSQEQIKKTIVAASNLATVTGVSLDQAVKDLDGTMEGKLGKSLGKLDADFKNLSKDQMYNGDAIDIVAKKYAGLAEEEMNTVEGKVILLGKSFKAFRRSIGDALIGSGGMFDGLIDGASSMLKTVTKWFEIPMSKKLEDEQVKVNSLASQLMQANLSSADRNKLYNELNTIAPQVLAGLDSENISYQGLTKNLAAYNDQMVNKIILSKQDEKIQSANETEAKARAARLKSENEFSDSMAKTVKTIEKKIQGEKGPAVKEAQAIIDEINKVMFNPYLNTRQKAEMLEKSKNLSGWSNSVSRVANDVIKSWSREVSALAGTNIELEAKNKLIKDLGINQAAIKPLVGPILPGGKVVEGLISKIDLAKKSLKELEDLVGKGIPGASETDKKNAINATKEISHRENLEQKAADKKEKLNEKTQASYKKLMESLAEMDGKNFADKLNQTQQEIKNVQDKYDNIIKEARKYKEENDKLLKPEEKAKIDDDISGLQIQRDAQVKQVLLQAEQDFTDKVKQIHENLRVARMSITEREIYEINKKYDDAEKEIRDTIESIYQYELSQASTGLEVLQAEQNKTTNLQAINKPVTALKTARKEETDKAVKGGDLKFEEDLNNLKLKGEKDLADGKEKIQLELQAKYKKILDENVGNESKTNEIKAQMAQELSDKEVELSKETAKKVAENALTLAKGAIDGLSQIFSMQSQSEQQRITEDEAANNKKKDNLKKQLDSKQISQKKYDEQVAKLDLDMDKKKKKLEHDQAVRNKEIALFNALIGVASAVAGALAVPPGPGGIAMSIITAILGAIQIGYILSTKVPEAGEGRYDLINKVVAQSKSDISRQTGKSKMDVVGENDGKLYRDVPFQKSFTGIPGRPMLVNETGNEIVIDPYTTKNLVMNYPQVIQAINYARVPQRAGGQYPDFGVPTSTHATAPVIIFPAGLKESIDKLNAHADKGLTAYMSFDHLEDIQAKVDVIRKNSSTN